MNFLIDPIINTKNFASIESSINNKKTPLALFGTVEGQISQLLYSLIYKKHRPIVFVAKDSLRARKVYEDLNSLDLENVDLLPKKDIFLYDRYLKTGNNIKVRLESLENIATNSTDVLVTSLDCLMEKLSHVDLYKSYLSEFKIGDEIDIKGLSQKLIDMGYEKVEQVESFGQFAIRGSIIDIYTGKGAIRIELFDVEIDSIRYFDVVNQRSIENIESFIISPASDFLIKDEYKKDIYKSLEKDMKSAKIKDKTRLESKFSKYLDYLKEGMAINNIDLLIPYIGEDRLSSFLDYFEERPLIVFEEANISIDKYLNEDELFKNNLAEMIESGEALKSHENISYDFNESIEKIKTYDLILLSSLSTKPHYFNPREVVNIRARSAISYKGRIDLFVENLKTYFDKNYKIVIMAGDEKRSKLLKELLFEKGINAVYSQDFNREIKEQDIIITKGTINEGFDLVEEKFLLLNYREIYGTSKKKKRSNKKKPLSFENLNVGDYVVHEAHGVGKYIGTQKLKVKDATKDYAVVEYRGQDKLFLPIENLDSIYKYSSQEAKPPKINKLNSVDWNRKKAKAKKSLENIAEDLVKLYASRMQKEGFRFSEDSVWQREFEDSFEYEETPGQLRAIEEIKEDMESNRPMDRILCADVGYGKTEVALRAAFKAIMDGKQVAFLVPTTILAQQHYQTMVDRFKDFPIRVALLSRFRTKKEQTIDLEDLKKGSVDIIVGTHRILSKDVKFKDLGLLIIDEEQRFGVRDKEKLKMIKENVDTLTLTATPIPRTLQMSMIGIRDVSVIEEPPEERFPVQSYVAEYNDMMIRDAVISELERDGQIYFVYNQVANIDKKLIELQNLIPEARIKVAHGQMSTNLLEDTMYEFMNHEFDLLLCSTIIETGMDIKNVNTMIISDAHRLGLSQLYQLRGRIGRSNKIAYAYFLYPANYSLTEIAQKRLKSIKEFTEFGSGYKIALKDLEIRGSGSILGAKQSGHINSIGYDLYIKYLKEAVLKLKDQDVEEEIDTSIDLKVDSYIPEDYIKDDNLRIDSYKKIASIENEEDKMDLIDELIDRFSDIPYELMNLIEIALLRNKAKKLGVISIIQKNNEFEIKLKDLELETINRIAAKYKKFEISADKEPSFKLFNLKDPINDIGEILEILKVTQKSHKKTN